MKLIATFVTALLLSGCMSSYQPTLSKPIEDQARYNTELQTCKQEAHDRQLNAAYSSEGVAKGSAIVAFGVVGLAGGAAISGKDDDYYKTPTTMVDECMALKGYPVVKVDHCC